MKFYYQYSLLRNILRGSWLAQNLPLLGRDSRKWRGKNEQTMKGKLMSRTLGIALSALCLVSTLAIAQMPGPGVDMVCTKIDAMGNCVEAKGADEKVVIT